MSSNLASPTISLSMQAEPDGVIPSQGIRRMFADGGITAGEPLVAGQVQPASLDLRLGREAYRVRASFLPGRAALADRLGDFEMHRFDLTGGAVLEKGCVYLVPLVERLALPAEVSAVANAKSSTGRLDLFTRLITDHGAEFDRIEAGYAGPLYAEISPRSFSVLVRAGMPAEPGPLPTGRGQARRRGAAGAQQCGSRWWTGRRISRRGSPSRWTSGSTGRSGGGRSRMRG